MVEINNNPWYTIYNNIKNVIFNNVTDVNSVRRGLSSSSEKNWIFPNAPEKSSNQFPVIAITLNSITPEEYGAGRYIDSSSVSGGIDESYGNYLNFDIVLTLFIKKKERFQVTLQNQSTSKYIQDNLLMSYLVTEITKQLKKNRNTFFNNDVDEFEINDITPMYEDNHMTYACDIRVTARMLDVWGISYDSDSLIDIINKSYTVERT
jgi:hypothetical protein